MTINLHWSLNFCGVRAVVMRLMLWINGYIYWQFSMAFNIPNIVIKPDLVKVLDRDRPCVLHCPKTQEHQSTFVDTLVHTEPGNGHQPFGRDNSVWCSAYALLWSNLNLNSTSRRLPPMYSLPLRLRNTIVDVRTQEYMGYPKNTSAMGCLNSIWPSVYSTFMDIAATPTPCAPLP